jgi:adenylate cyclase
MSFRVPIAFKLITMTTALLLLATIRISTESARLFETTAQDREEFLNSSQSASRATEVESLFVSYIDKVKTIAAMLLKTDGNSQQREEDLKFTFYGDRDLVSVEVLAQGQEQPLTRVVNSEYLAQYKLDSQFIPTLRQHQLHNKRLQLGAVFAGEVEIRNGTIEGGAPLLTLSVPFVKDEFGRITHIAVADIRLDRLQKVFASVTERTLYLVDKEGFLLAHPDEKLIFGAQNMKEAPIVKAALQSHVRQGQLRFTDEKGTAFTGAYTHTPMGMTVVCQASEEIILEAAHAVKRKGFYYAGTALSIALFLVFFFSLTLTSPIERLVEVAHEIAKGNFKVRSQIRTRDEVGDLAVAIDNMTEGLIERDKAKSVLTKFHGSTVMDELMKGKLQLGGSKKEVTVFFSDIRDFTHFSEIHPAEHVVDVLNQYFQIMVNIINKHHGVVDKFIGDAIMAVWGVPNSHPDDTIRAMRACLEMRTALAAFNEMRVQKGHEPLRIGMGLHTGAVISGNIGSLERMEYTVIGDTVNQTSRIESATKAMGLDLVISHQVAEKVNEKFLIEKVGDVQVKGKQESLALYRVMGYLDETGKPTVIQTPYSQFEASHSEKVRLVS